MLIPEVPESIPRSDVVAFLNSIGIDPAWCASIELRQNGIYAEMFARYPEGGKIITNDGVATHKVFVRFDSAVVA